MRPLIALLTDFGVRDHYVASIKGTILGICRDAALVDITHEIPPQDVAAGALELAACYRFFPAGTIFLAVVDPGVGSGRRAVAAEAGAWRFIAPDNGLLGPVLDEVPPSRAVELNRREYSAPSVSRTFEGRDRFAPAAAWLAAGVALESLGDPVQEWTRLHLPRAVPAGDGIQGEVVRVDGFGNLVSNIPAAAVEQLRGGQRRQVTATVAGGPRLPFVGTYGDVPAGAPCALVGSTGHVEISVNCGSAARHLGAGRGARVTVQCTP
jgi:hypothetical protein